MAEEKTETVVEETRSYTTETDGSPAEPETPDTGDGEDGDGGGTADE